MNIPAGAFSYKSFPYDEFDLVPILARPRGNQRQKKNLRYYKDIICAFDIETTKTEDRNAFMYVWQLQIGLRWTVVGRTWKEFKRCISGLISHLLPDQYIVIYVHNLSHEFQFLSGIYPFKTDEVFCLDSRKILRADMYEHIEFRCSYIHSNMSLNEFTHKMGAEHAKLSGEDFDYSIVRYPWTPLSPEEWAYSINDVLGLVEALYIELAHDGDTLYTVPATSTGYVRRDVKKALRLVNYHFIHDQLPDAAVFSMLREAFRGGNTHASRFMAGRVLHDVKSADRSSSYPAVQCQREFPISAFFRMPRTPSIEEVVDLMEGKHKALLLRIALWGVKLQDELWPCPYLSKDKCRQIVGGYYDNGRILNAEYLETTITDIDLRIILDEYDPDAIEVLDCAYARYGRLPAPLVRCIESYYKAKTSLKGIKEQELFYMKSKNKLNSVYGMSAQNPIKRTIEYRAGDYEPEDVTLDELIDKYQKKGFFPYQWGVWTTAHARAELEAGIRLAEESARTPAEGFVYADTDSVKYIGDVDWSGYNKEMERLSRNTGAFASDPAGNVHYMGVYEFEGVYSEFATRGAKKYVCRHEGGPLECTIAGVNKKKGGEELEKNGGFSAFLAESFTFREAGGTVTVYNDDVDELRIIDGHKLHLTKNVAICDDVYTLSDTKEYAALLEDSQILSKFMMDKYGLL